ncbi:hypothetical protein AB0F17_33525 [Nonomuraea sp. NPDC026600]|uniref:hypothetical protein n=1 Tax=Nonomuraea sp. NPDC026600 TaxID=3155363 RepID=UPI0034068607
MTDDPYVRLGEETAARITAEPTPSSGAVSATEIVSGWVVASVLAVEGGQVDEMEVG